MGGGQRATAGIKVRPHRISQKYVLVLICSVCLCRFRYLDCVYRRRRYLVLVVESFATLVMNATPDCHAKLKRRSKMIGGGSQRKGNANVGDATRHIVCVAWIEFL